MSLRRAARAALLPTVLVVVAGLLVPGPAAAEPLITPTVFSPCATALPTGDDVSCLAVERATTRAGASPAVAAAPVPDGITPNQLQAAYGVAGASAPAGTTVGIVVAYDAPTVEADLARFRSTYGLPACTTANGCFRKVDQRGVTVPAGKSTSSTVKPVYRDDGWQLETTLDTQAVSAMCPSCRILLVEADDAGLTTGLGPAVARADAMGSTVISNSFAGGESQDMIAAEQTYWSRVAAPVFAASGDHAWNNLDLAAGDPAYNHANYPASSPSVVTVGGTSATVSQTGVVTNESAWSDAGSGCSFSFARPAFQTAYFTAIDSRPDADTFCTTQGGDPARAAADLSAFADPYAPGFPVYRAATGGWTVAGGTSLSVQLVAALAAYAGVRGTGSSIDQVAYALAGAGAGATAGLADVTTGSNKPPSFGCSSERICAATSGWDGPTGLGTPRGPGLFAPLLTVSPTSTVGGATLTLTGANWLPGEQVHFDAGDARVGTAVATDSGGFTFTVTLPADATGTVPLLATGLTSGLTATVPVTVTPVSVTPTSQTVTRGNTVSIRLFGFGVREDVTATADDGDGPDVVATGTTGGNGGATLTWTASGSGTQRVVVTGATTGRTSTVFVSVTTGAGLPDAPTILSAVPTTAGGALVGVRVAATGVDPTSVAVIGSDGSVARTSTISNNGDAFVTVPTLAAGASVTYTAVAGTSAGDSVRSAPSLAITGSTAPGTGDLTPVGPVRRLDTRGNGGPLGQGAVRRVQIAGVAGVPATGVAAVAVSLTVLTPTARTYLTLWPSDEPRPTVSNANTPGAGGFKASLAKVKLSADGGIDVYNNGGSAGFILDIVGFYASGSSTDATFAHNQSYAAVTPVRVADTRGVTNSPVRSGGSITVPIRGGATGVPADANSVELIVQAVNATTSGYVTVYPTGRAGGVPLVSNVQAAPGKPVATAVVATIGSNGTVTVFAQAHTDVIVDVVGYYAGSANGRFTPISPRRYYDTRTAGLTPFGQGVSRTVAIAGAPARDGSRQVPDSATAVSFSLTAVDNTASTYVTAWRAGTSRPLVTSLLPSPANGVFDNLGLAGVSSSGGIALYNNGGSVDLIVDVQGYYTNGPA